MISTLRLSDMEYNYTKRRPANFSINVMSDEQIFTFDKEGTLDVKGIIAIISPFSYACITIEFTGSSFLKTKKEKKIYIYIYGSQS